MNDPTPLPPPPDAPAELVRVLDELASILAPSGNTHWATWVEDARIRIAASDLGGIEYLLRAYGGMGSLNDIFIPDRKLNERLESLRSRAWALSKLIQRSSDVQSK